MYSFKDDYSEGCHPLILEALLKTNLAQQEGYGDDDYTKEATKIIKQRFSCPGSDVFFVAGGTLANLLVIASALRPYEAAVSASTGHICVHEAGAIEATGHKIITIDSPNGKITPHNIKSILEAHSDIPHMVKPKIVYISNSTELGTIYKKQELKELYTFCKEQKLYLYMDGARLGSAISAHENDLELKDLSELTDIFYIGGTKNGALLGEAIVINNDELKQEFNFHIKQRGALLAKSRIIGIQFLELFKSDLYFELASHANKMALKMYQAIETSGFKFYTDFSTNQIFPIFPNSLIEELSKNYSFHIWKKIDDKNSVIRLVTSWATKEESIDGFYIDLKNLTK